MGNWNLIAEQMVEMRDPTLDKIIVQHSTQYDTTTFFCFAPIGTAQSAAKWRIYRIKSISLTPPTKDVWGHPRLTANDPFTSEYQFICDNRETYTYSQDS